MFGCLIGSGRGVYLPLAGGTMEGTLVLDANPVSPMEAATKVYVDTIATGARMIIGVDRRDERALHLYGARAACLRPRRWLTPRPCPRART